MLPIFCSFVEAVSEKICLEIFQSETRIAYGGPVCQRIGSKISNPNKIPSMDAFYQDLVHLFMQFHRFEEINQPET